MPCTEAYREHIMYTQYERLCPKNGPQRVCPPGGPLPGAGAGVPPAAVRQQSQSGGAPCEHLRRPLPQRAPGAPKGLRRFVGASLRAVGEAGPSGGPVTRGSDPGRPASGHRVQRRGNRIMIRT